MESIGYDEQLKLFEENAGLARFTVQKYFTDLVKDEDILQEAFIGLWIACKSFNPKLGAFSTIAVKCISTAILKELARRKKSYKLCTLAYNEVIPDNESLSFADTIVDPAGSAEDSGVLVKDFFGSLNECDQKIVMLRLKGTSQVEASKQLGFSQANYHRRLTRIRKLYKQYAEA